MVDISSALVALGIWFGAVVLAAAAIVAIAYALQRRGHRHAAATSAVRAADAAAPRTAHGHAPAVRAAAAARPKTARVHTPAPV